MRPTTLFKETLNKYKNDIFVETGTSEGAGVDLALSLGFKKIYSIEIDPKLQKNNILKFIDNPEVTLITGDSLTELKRIVPDLKEKTTFWLDAHYEKLGPVGEKQCPLYEELLAISSSPIKNHTILIDDIRILNKKNWGNGIIKNRLLDLLFDINPNYIITYEDNLMAKNDILVAYV